VNAAEVDVRPETAADHPAIAAMLSAAFGRPEEARLVDLIRASPEFVEGLSLVAEREGQVVGHVLFSHVELRDGQTSTPVLQLAPVAVAPEHQGTGIGGRLIEDGLTRADVLGEPLVLVVGHAGYYPRFGFRPASTLGIGLPFPVPDDVFLARPLAAYRPELRGQVRFPPAFDAV
jgi:putative acetyltransferase